MPNKLTLTVLLVASALCRPSWADPFEDAAVAYEHGDYAAAMRLFLSLADQGDAGAQYNLGDMYANGRGVPQDYAEAVR